MLGAHLAARWMTRRKRASASHPFTYVHQLTRIRISPRPPTTKPPSKAQDTNGKQPDATADAEVETVVTPPPAPSVEETLAQRRAKRQAILAKYAGIASIGASASPSPGPSSAVSQPPPDSVVNSNTVTPQTESVSNGTPALAGSPKQNGAFLVLTLRECGRLILASRPAAGGGGVVVACS